VSHARLVQNWLEGWNTRDCRASERGALLYFPAGAQGGASWLN